jgi:hypothetical protein
VCFYGFILCLIIMSSQSFEIIAFPDIKLIALYLIDHGAHLVAKIISGYIIAGK